MASMSHYILVLQHCWCVTFLQKYLVF